MKSLSLFCIIALTSTTSTNGKNGNIEPHKTPPTGETTAEILWLDEETGKKYVEIVQSSYFPDNKVTISKARFFITPDVNSSQSEPKVWLSGRFYLKNKEGKVDGFIEFKKVLLPLPAEPTPRTPNQSLERTAIAAVRPTSP